MTLDMEHEYEMIDLDDLEAKTKTQHPMMMMYTQEMIALIARIRELEAVEDYFKSFHPAELDGAYQAMGKEVNDV